MKPLPLNAAVLILLAAAAACPAQKAPFPYVWGKAYHILPETHNTESGYFSLCEGRDGKVYVGTAKYGANSFLVEFDPKTEKQKVVLDTHRVCGLSATGYAAQAKIHTRNFVGPSGLVYLGSKQGYPIAGDTQEYPGGYVMTYDPKTGKSQCLGMPVEDQGVGDVVADEKRGLVYVVAEAVKTGQYHRWMLYDQKTKKYRELGPRLTAYAATLIDGKGRANAITGGEFRLAQYDPAEGKVNVRPIEVDGQQWDAAPVPTWNLAADGRTAYLMLMSDATLVEIDLYSEGQAVKARRCGRMIAGRNPDSRCALSIGPDGKVYAVIRVDNTTRFGTGYLHHLVRYDPKARKMEDLGVLAVKNPTFFTFRPKPNKPAPWSHGYHKLPDGTLTPLHHHMAMIVGKDGTIYVTILYPFTLLKIDAYRQAGRKG
jgi:hypothetical protein